MFETGRIQIECNRAMMSLIQWLPQRILDEIARLFVKICSRRRIILLDDLLKKKKLTNLRTVEGLHPLLSVFSAAQFGAIKTKEAQ